MSHEKNIQFYTVSYPPAGMAIKVEIDPVKIKELLPVINSSVAKGEQHSLETGGNPLHAVLKLLCETVLSLPTSTLSGVLKHFNDNSYGWPAMDGSKGIRLASLTQIMIGDADISIKLT